MCQPGVQSARKAGQHMEPPLSNATESHKYLIERSRTWRHFVSAIPAVISASAGITFMLGFSIVKTVIPVAILVVAVVVYYCLPREKMRR